MMHILHRVSKGERIMIKTASAPTQH